MTGKQAGWDSIVVGAGRLRRLDCVVPAQVRAKGAAGGRLRRRARTCLLGRRITHDARRVRPGRGLHAHGLRLADAVALAVRALRPAGLPSHRRRVLLPEARALRGPVRRGAHAPQTTHRGPRSRGARAALAAGELEGHRRGTVRARLRRVDGAPRRADAGEAVREGRRRVPGRGGETARCVEGAGVARARRWLDGLRGQLRVRLRTVAAQAVRAPARAAHLRDTPGSVLLRAARG